VVDPVATPSPSARISFTRLVLIAFPVYVLVAYFLVWCVGLGKAGFWADDFTNMHLYSHSLGDLTNYDGNTGKYTINLFWGLMTTAFGSGSVVPYLVVDSLTLFAGLFLWFRWGVGRHWSATTAWWIAALTVGCGSLLEDALWSSNIVHSFGFLALGLGVTAHERCMRATTRRDAYIWSVGTGLCWTAAVMSNLIYLGLIVLGAYCAWLQLAKLRTLGVDVRRALSVLAGFAIVLPVVFVAAIAYPGTKTHGGYTNTGFGFIRDDLHYYREEFAPAGWLEGTYIGLATLELIGGLEALRRKDLFPLALLATGVAIAIPALMQSSQLYVHYMGMPLLMFFSGLGVLFERVRRSRPSWIVTGVLLAAAAFFLAIVFGQSDQFRYYFSTTPYGSTLRDFRNEVAAVEQPGAPLCLRLKMPSADQTLLEVEMGGTNGFAAEPIASGATYFLGSKQPCPVTGTVSHIAVTMAANGDWVAHAGHS
jgi:hypothetical protein